MIAFILAEIQVLLLALDVVNFRNDTTIDMFRFWQLIYLCSFIWTTIVLPFCFFFYDSDEDLAPVSTNFLIEPSFLQFDRQSAFSKLSPTK